MKLFAVPGGVWREQLTEGPVATALVADRSCCSVLRPSFAGGVVCALVPSLPALLLGRAAQGLGAACTLVAARATARDHFKRPTLARVIAAITIAFAVVPRLTPLLDGVLAQWVGWGSSLWATVAAGLVIWLWVWHDLPRHQSRRVARTGRLTIFATYGSILRD